MIKFYFSTVFAMIFCLQWTFSQNIIESSPTVITHDYELIRFQIPQSEFQSVKLLIHVEVDEAYKVKDEFLSIMMKNQHGEMPEYVEFARIYLPYLFAKVTVNYEIDMVLWQNWLRKDEKIYIQASDKSTKYNTKAGLVFEEGPAPFKVKDIIPLWQSNSNGFEYGKAGIDGTLLPTQNIKLPSGCNSAFASILVSGNQSGQNASGRFYFLKHNGNEIARRSVWRDDCGLNPLFPQQHEWYLERPNWCPGLQVHPINHFLDMTSMKPDELNLDLVFQSDQTETSGIDAFVISSVLFALEVPAQVPQLAISEILAPNTNSWHQRYNPICGTPVILVQNRGLETIEEITFNYGYNYQTDNKFRWVGELGFMEEEIIYLPSINWYFYENDDEPENFTVHVSSLNGSVNGFSGAKKTSEMILADVLPYKLKFDIVTDHNGFQNGLEIFNDNGDPFFISGDLKPDTMYQFQLNFVPGCYEMIFYDLDGNGVKLNNNLPVLRILDQKKNTELKRFEPDFGTEIREQFMIFR